MKIRFLSVAILLLAALALVACSPQPEPQPEAEQPPMSEEATQAPVEEAATEMPEEPAQAIEPTEDEMEAEALPAATEVDVDALIREKVAGNHDLERIYGATFTREEWEKTLDRMIAYGAEINEEEKRIIIDYLLSLNN